MREEIFTYIKKKYKVSPEYPWGKYENNAVFRHSDNQKWFALEMEVGRDKLGLPGNENRRATCTGMLRLRSVTTCTLEAQHVY